MKELDEMYDWLIDLKDIRTSYGKTGAKNIFQEDLDQGMRLYLQLKKKVVGQTKAIKMYFDSKNLLEKLSNE